ncbi:retinol dehydrogenase 13-like [Ylistrum balloti]|uniref:retinol dehydrogenase 13-like n=1 Tax=Ylistrum balloti TaxID=509963 RepID=UPI002905B963|nr:retinol dehydrogenase 13-like [Ylistrum balloti]
MKFPEVPKNVFRLSLFGSLCGAVVLIKDYTKGKTYKSEERMTGKTVIITGANSGIGKATSFDLAKRGARVVMACRDMRSCEKARDEIVKETFNQGVCCKYLDLSSMQSIRRFAEEMNKGNRVDVLINNAAIMMCKRALTLEGIELQLGVNHFGSFLLTYLLLDKLKECAPSRIVNLTSLSYKTTNINFDDLNSDTVYNESVAYKQSKLALVLSTKEFAKRLEGTGVTANLVYPGVVKTNIGRHTDVKKSFLSRAVLGPAFWLVEKSPDEGAQTVIYAAIEPSIAKVTGKIFIDLEEQNIPYLRETDEADAKRLFAVSQKWTRLT